MHLATDVAHFPAFGQAPIPKVLCKLTALWGGSPVSLETSAFDSCRRFLMSKLRRTLARSSSFCWRYLFFCSSDGAPVCDWRRAKVSSQVRLFFAAGRLHAAGRPRPGGALATPSVKYSLCAFGILVVMSLSAAAALKPRSRAKKPARPFEVAHFLDNASKSHQSHCAFCPCTRAGWPVFSSSKVHGSPEHPWQGATSCIRL